MNQKFAPLAECGKLVVYLYPERPTQVSVKVDADITKSEPLYNNGWNVFAQPSGQLSLSGKIYNSLFWEDQGKSYPDINAGFVVKSEKIKETLIDHLTKLGLNKNEIDDFLEFWLPRMPKTPYVRLTWFGTRQMDQIAPLTINPKPQTIIRVFLDFEGLDHVITISPQKLLAPERKGFTAVEWGGLLRNKK